jgi:hypothetical protein
MTYQQLHDPTYDIKSLLQQRDELKIEAAFLDLRSPRDRRRWHQIIELLKKIRNNMNKLDGICDKKGI